VVRFEGLPGGLRIHLADRTGRETAWDAARPVWVRRSDEPLPDRVDRRPYDELRVEPSMARGSCAFEVLGARVRLRDVWRVVDAGVGDGGVGDAGVVVERQIRIRGAAPGVGLATGVGLAAPSPGWAPWLPFAPGAVYGDAEPVGDDFIGSPAQRRRGAPAILVREDRLTAPVFALVGRDRPGLSVWDDAPDARTVLADGEDREGRPIVDARIRVMSLGAELLPGAAAVAAWWPAREGDVTYDAGALPLGQHRGWRERFAPLADGVVSWCAGFAPVVAGTWSDAMTSVWDAAWSRARPHVAAIPDSSYLDATADVLAGQARRDPSGRTGIGLESDPTTGRPVTGADAAVMGFVGANTDAALVLLVADAGDSPRAGRLRARAGELLDAFATIPVDPPAGEGFDLATGRPACYRTLDGRDAVFLRSFAEGLLAALQAAALAGPRGDAWRRWALRGGAWLLRQQRPDGTFPRAWAAGTGEVLQASPTATALAVPFLVALAEAAERPGADGFPGADGVARAGEAAVAAGEASWRRFERGQGFAGATLDNPDVVDKEAAVFALEAALELARRTGDRRWIDRAVLAARHAETWVQLWTPPMPEDAADEALHWKRGRPAVGTQGITTGVTMSDGFLTVDAVAFTELARLTGDEHWREVARLVFHGPKAMLARRGDVIDLAGPGWQQEHWNLGPNRGFGLNRHWLPWAAVATLRGHQRLVASGDPAAIAIARGIR